MKNKIFKVSGYRSYVKKALKSWGQGDTIVEVMLSMTVLAVVILTTYALSSKAFQSGLNSQYRDQAVSYAQQQLELIKEADINNPQTINKYLPPPTGSGPASGTIFCINPSTKAVQSGSNCVVDNNQYTVHTLYNSGAKTFQVYVTWKSSTGTTQQSTVYYKPTDSFNGNLQPACLPNTTDPLCAPVQTDVPAVHLTANSSGPNVPATITVNWTYTNVNAATCNATGGSAGWSGDPNVKTLPTGAYTSPVITSANTFTFTLTCNDNANNPVSDSVPVTISNPTPTVALTATPHQLGLQFSSAGPVAGKSCISLNETADVYTWSDNYLCWPTTENLGLSWVTNGPTNAGVTSIGGQTCVNTFEGSDPDTWWDNYLCSPRDYGFRWNSGGPIGGMYCTQWNESADPFSWADNYLCEPTNSAVDLSWTSTNATSCSRSWAGGSVGTSGSETQFGLTTNPTNFTVTCTNSGFNQSDTQPVNVGGIAAQPACAGSFCAAYPQSLTAYYYKGSNFDRLQRGPYYDPTIWFLYSSNGDNGFKCLLETCGQARCSASVATNCSTTWRGYIKVDTAGWYYVATNSDDGMRAYIDTSGPNNNFVNVINDWGPGGPRWAQAGPYWLNPGWYSIGFDWNQNQPGGDYEMEARAFWYGPWGYWEGPISSSRLRPY